MAAKSFGKQVASAFNREKPNSSITQWVDILTAAGYEEEAYDGYVALLHFIISFNLTGLHGPSIPEIVDSINLQPTG